MALRTYARTSCAIATQYSTAREAVNRVHTEATAHFRWPQQGLTTKENCMRLQGLWPAHRDAAAPPTTAKSSHLPNTICTSPHRARHKPKACAVAPRGGAR
eukprot:3214404-Amphidinium_carterae.7